MSELIRYSHIREFRQEALSTGPSFMVFLNVCINITASIHQLLQPLNKLRWMGPLAGRLRLAE
jgi:hypothetical protein